MGDDVNRWITLDLERPLASLREAAGMSQCNAGQLLGLPIQGYTCTTLASREQRGGRPQIRVLLEMAKAYGLEVEIRVRRR